MASRVQRKDRKYKDLSMKQKTRIADKTYREYLTFYLKYERMPEEEEAAIIHRKLFQSVLVLAPLATFEDFEKICQKHSAKYEGRILSDISRGITVESLHKPRKTPEEKAAILKAKNEERRKRRKKKKLQESQALVVEQDDTFFFIAGYTSGGAPYGVTWEQMDMDPYDEIELEDAQMSRKLVAYFSASGVTGNVAKILAEAANAGLYEIKPAVPYTDADLNWMDKKSRSSVEMQDKTSRPEMVDYNAPVADADVIFVGFPIWWYVAPHIINSFLESYDFSGKTIVLFATSGGSDFGRTLEVLEDSVHGTARLMEGRMLNGMQDKEALKSWVDSLDL